MKIHRINIVLTMVLILSGLLLTGCQKNNLQTEVTFKLAPYTGESDTKSGTIKYLPIGTEVRIIAYKRSRTATRVDILTATPTADAVYVVYSSTGDLSPKNSTMTLVSGYYDFYAYTPSQAVYRYPIVLVEHGTDIIGSPAVLKIFVGGTGTVELPLFHHRASQVVTTISYSKSVSEEISSMGVADAGIAFYNQSPSPAQYQLGEDIAIGETTDGSHSIDKSRFSDYTEANDIYTIKGDDVVLPKALAPYRINFNLKINGNDKTLTSTISAMAFLARYSYKFSLSFSATDIVCKLTIAPWNGFEWSDGLSGGYTFEIGSWEIIEWDSNFGSTPVLRVGDWREYNWSENMNESVLAVIKGWTNIAWNSDFSNE